MLVAVVDSLALVYVFTDFVHLLESLRTLAEIAAFSVLTIVVLAAVVASIGALVYIVAKESVSLEAG